MRQRCTNPKHPQYRRYGGRGITVCEEWLKDPRPFIEWGMAHGYAKGLEIDRRDNDKGYSSGNCRFVTEPVQASNRYNPPYTEEEKLKMREVIIASNKRRAGR